jgi:hypothetical protein
VSSAFATSRRCASARYPSSSWLTSFGSTSNGKQSHVSYNKSGDRRLSKRRLGFDLSIFWEFWNRRKHATTRNKNALRVGSLLEKLRSVGFTDNPRSATTEQNCHSAIDQRSKRVMACFRQLPSQPVENSALQSDAVIRILGCLVPSTRHITEQASNCCRCRARG